MPGSKGKEKLVIRIRSRKEGFRRCGTAHGIAWSEYPDDCFTGEQLTILKDEPMLDIEVIPSGKPPGVRDSEMESSPVCGSLEDPDSRAEQIVSAPQTSRSRAGRKD